MKRKLIVLKDSFVSRINKKRKTCEFFCIKKYFTGFLILFLFLILVLVKLIKYIF